MSYLAVKSHFINKFIVPSNVFYKMLREESLQVAISYLEGTTYYQALLENIQFPESLRDLIEREFINKILRIINWSKASSSDVIKQYLMKYPLRMIISIVKTRFYGQKTEITDIQREIIRLLYSKIDLEAILNKPFSQLIDELSQLHILALNNDIIEFARLKRIFLPIEILFWKEYYRQLLQFLDGNNLVSRFISTEIDIRNIYSAMLLSGIKMRPSLLVELYIPGGKIPRRYFLEMATSRHARDILSKVPGKYKGLAEAYILNDALRLSFEEHRILYSIIKLAEIKQYTEIGFVFYVLKKMELEKYNLQLVIGAFVHGLDKSIIKDLLIRY